MVGSTKFIVKYRIFLQISLGKWEEHLQINFLKAVQTEVRG